MRRQQTAGTLSDCKQQMLTLEICDRGYVMENGGLTLYDNAPAVLANPQVRRAYLGE